MQRHPLTLLALTLIIFTIPSERQHAQEKLLSYKQVFEFAQPRITQSLPSISGWIDGDHYLETRSSGMGARLIHKVNAVTGDAEIYFDYKKWNAGLPEEFRLDRASDKTEDYSNFLFNIKNDVYFYSTDENKLRQITDNPESEDNPSFSPDGKFIAFTRSNDLYVYDIEKDTERRLTSDGSEDILNGYASWVYYEEILGRSSRYRAYWWSPNGSMIAFLKFDDRPVPKFPICLTDDPHGKIEWQRYPKAGDPNPIVSLGIYDLKKDSLIFIVEDEEEGYIACPMWTSDGKDILYQRKNRGQDSVVLHVYHINSKETRAVYKETQNSWVDFFEDVYLFKDNSGFIIRSDKDGWYHLYRYDSNGRLMNRITDGNWAVKDVHYVDERNKTIYFHASIEESTEKHLYKTDFEGSGLKKLTGQAGYYSASVSPGGKYFYSRYSDLNTPNKLLLYDGEGNFIRELGNSKTDIYDDYKMPLGELFRISTADGFDLPVRWYLPPDFDEEKKYPVIVSVYGGPGSASVFNSYPMFRSGFYYAQNNIIYMDIDHRGSGHFGKKGESEMHRNLGKWEMNDYIEVVNWLRTKSFIDTTKIGITGGSYGGYVACMALTYGSDFFTHGIAEFSVTDWRFYDNFYTERFMDKPGENPEGYLFGSVLTHAEKYKGILLIIHSMLDDNVHVQNTVEFIDKLTDLNKDFEMIIYPNARHGVGMPKRRHLSRETVQFWFKHFLNKEISHGDK